MLPALLLAARLTVPTPHDALIAEHLRRIEAAGWATVIPGDLYHAHLILAPRAKSRRSMRSLNELFRNAVVILYHSDEMLTRWRMDDGELPIEQRRPRSILGYPDGSIAPAVSLLEDPRRQAPDYSWYGSIHSDDLARALPERFLERRDWLIGRCSVNLIVDIYRHPEDGKLQLTMECARR